MNSGHSYSECMDFKMPKKTKKEKLASIQSQRESCLKILKQLDEQEAKLKGK